MALVTDEHGKIPWDKHTEHHEFIEWFKQNFKENKRRREELDSFIEYLLKERDKLEKEKKEKEKRKLSLKASLITVIFSSALSLVVAWILSFIHSFPTGGK